VLSHMDTLHTMALLAILEYAVAVGDASLIELARTGYECRKAARSDL